MKKTIKITQTDIEKNQHILQGKTVGEIITFTESNFPKVWNNTTVNYNANLEHLGFKAPIKPELQANEKYGSIVEVGEDFMYSIVQIPEPTAQELYDTLIEEGKQVFQQFTTDLAEATLPRLIAGSVPSELQQLSAILQVTKTRINNDLKLMLDNNMAEELKSFSFQTEEAEQLRQAIEKFK